MALHHLDPSKKDFSFGAIRANAINWNSIVIELRKCVLICHNCHNEVHDDMTEIPLDAPKFDEKFVDYKQLADLKKGFSFTNCAVCEKPKAPHLKHCSRGCAAKSQYKVDWDSIDLELEYKTKSAIQISEEIGCSDGAVYKRLKKLKLR